MRRVSLAVLLGVIAWCLSLPLQDIFAYPDRVSVLPNLQTDAQAYHDLARQLAETGSLDALPAKHPPGWIALLGAVYAVAGVSFVAGKLVSWLALAASVWACWWLAARMYSRRAGWVAALVCASSPALRGYVGTLQYEVTAAALLLAVMVLAVRAIEAPTRAVLYRRAAEAGVTGALLVLTRETFAVVVPVIGLWIAHRASTANTMRSAAATVALVTVVAATPAILWSAVQSAREGQLVTISVKGPMVVELGHNPLANGTYNAPLVGIGQPTGLAFIAENPGRSIVLAGRKVLYFWGVLRDGWNVPRPGAVWAWRATTGLVPLEVFGALARGGWLLAFFAASLWMLGRDGFARWWTLPLAVLIVMSVHVATLSSHRFAVPVLPVVFVLVSGPLSSLALRLRAVLRSPAVALAVALLVAVVVAMQFQAWPLELRYDAVNLDGLEADNVVDPISGERVRSANAARGTRPIVLLTDEYLPAGSLRLDVSMRRGGTVPSGDTPVASVSLVHLDGRVACARTVAASELRTDRFEALSLSCRLTQDGPATLAVQSLGAADLAVGKVGLRWR